MKKYIFPSISRSDLLPIVKFALVGAFMAGFYGVLHDQFTYSISHEYFTKLKFNQFSYANFEIGDLFFVGTIGFLATWWVGLFVGWLLARRFVPGQPYAEAKKSIYRGFAIVFLCGITFGMAAYIYGTAITPTTNLNGWSYTVRYLGVVDGWSFVRVAYIHYGSYAGGFIGLVASIVLLGKKIT